MVSCAGCLEYLICAMGPADTMRPQLSQALEQQGQAMATEDKERVKMYYKLWADCCIRGSKFRISYENMARIKELREIDWYDKGIEDLICLYACVDAELFSQMDSLNKVLLQKKRLW